MDGQEIKDLTARRFRERYPTEAIVVVNCKSCRTCDVSLEVYRVAGTPDVRLDMAETECSCWISPYLASNFIGPNYHREMKEEALRKWREGP